MRLGHSDPKSSLRYQDADVEVVRAASAKMPRLRGAAETDAVNNSKLS